MSNEVEKKMKDLETKVILMDTDKIGLDKFKEYSNENKLGFRDLEK